MSMYILTKNDYLIDVVTTPTTNTTDSQGFMFIGDVIINTDNPTVLYEDCEIYRVNGTPIYRDKYKYKYILGEYIKEGLHSIETYLYHYLWSNEGVYDFESIYPSDIYDINIMLDSKKATKDHKLAFDLAEIVGSTDNEIKAYGKIPNIDIPIIIKVVDK